MKKRLLNLLIPLLVASSASAADERHALIISFHEGDSVTLVLADKPCATFLGDSLCVESNDFGATYLRSSIAGFHFGWVAETPSSVASLPEHMVQIVYTDNNTVQVRGIDPASPVGVYGIDGCSIVAPITSEADGITISLAAFPAGIYLININNIQTFKIIKR